MKRLVVYLPDDVDARVTRVANTVQRSRSETGKLLIEAALKQADGLLPKGWDTLIGGSEGRDMQEGHDRHPVGR